LSSQVVSASAWHPRCRSNTAREAPAI
jgi:hypothetical protein